MMINIWPPENSTNFSEVMKALENEPNIVVQEVDRRCWPVGVMGFGAPVGQCYDIRYPLSRGRALHEQGFPDGTIRFHIDKHAPFGLIGTFLHLLDHVRNECARVVATEAYSIDEPDSQ